MFLNPIMVAGVAGAVVPLVLHLLAKARYRSIDWGAMMFLTGAEARQRQSTKVKQWVLLGLRMLMVGLLAVALARPVVSGAWGGWAQEGGVTAVIVLDRSASMGYEQNGVRRMQMAREAVLQILSTLRKGDQAALVLMGGEEVGSEKGMAEGGTGVTSDLQDVAARVDNTRTGTREADAAAGLARAAEVLDRAGGVNREIYVVCDRQALTWRGADEAFAAAWRRKWEGGSGKGEAGEGAGGATRVVVVPVGNTEADNLAVESVGLVNPPAVEGQEAEVEVRVRNYGATPRTGVQLTVTGPGRPPPPTALALEANSARTVRVGMKFAAAGSHVVSASLSGGGLAIDDQRECAVDVIEPVKVLIVSGDEREGAFRSESDFVRAALAPFKAAGRGGKDLAVVDVRPAEKWDDLELGAYQVVILANVAQVSEAEVRGLERFVYGGGGLLIAPGNMTRLGNYNELLWHDGAGLMPAVLMPATDVNGSGATSVLGLRLEHPVFQFLQGRPDPVPSATIGRYFPAREREAEGKLAEYASGRPFLIESRAGRGRVMLMTTPLDRDWGTLPLSSFYLPFVQSMTRYLAGGMVADRNLSPGQMIRSVYDEPIDPQNAYVDAPGRPRERAEVQRFGDRSEVRYGNTDQPGTYTVRVQPAGTLTPSKAIGMRHFVVQVPRAESDLTPLTGAQWAELGERLGFRLIDGGGKPIVAVLAGEREAKELWLGLVAAVLALGVVEMVVARQGTQAGDAEG